MYIRKLRDCVGMFSNVNNIIRHCIYVDKHNLKPFFVLWKSKLYQFNRNQNLWEIYFEQPFFTKIDKEYNKSNIIELPKIIEKYKRYIMPCKGYLVIDPIERSYVNSIIKKYIKFKPFLIEKKNKFLKQFKGKYLIGLHVRGSGHLHNGTKIFRKKFKMINKIPITEYIKHLNIKIIELKKGNIEYEILLFTDNNFILNYFKERFPIKYYNSERADNHYGEIHIHNNDKKIRSKIAEDILIETLIMSDLNFYIHGMSNISNFVLCNNPNLKHINIYSKFF